jgi:hypothetical protein
MTLNCFALKKFRPLASLFLLVSLTSYGRGAKD